MEVTVGFYIEPKDMSAETLLTLKGIEIVSRKPFFPLDKKNALVCLVDNFGNFKAAGIAFSRAEMARFNSPTDRRPKVWYIIEKDVIKPHVRSFDKIPFET